MFHLSWWICAILLGIQGVANVFYFLAFIPNNAWTWPPLALMIVTIAQWVLYAGTLLVFAFFWHPLSELAGAFEKAIQDKRGASGGAETPASGLVKSWRSGVNQHLVITMVGTLFLMVWAIIYYAAYTTTVPTSSSVANYVFYKGINFFGVAVFLVSFGTFVQISHFTRTAESGLGILLTVSQKSGGVGSKSK